MQESRYEGGGDIKQSELTMTGTNRHFRKDKTEQITIFEKIKENNYVYGY